MLKCFIIASHSTSLTSFSVHVNPSFLINAINRSLHSGSVLSFSINSFACICDIASSVCWRLNTTPDEIETISHHYLNNSFVWEVPFLANIYHSIQYWRHYFSFTAFSVGRVFQEEFCAFPAQCMNGFVIMPGAGTEEVMRDFLVPERSGGAE